MPENKKYIIEIPGMNGADAWDADRWERNAAQFSTDNPDANVFEVDTYNPEDEQEGDQYMISIPGYNGADLWDADRWSRNKEQFMADHPDAQIQRVRLVNYWEAQAKENRAKREALKGSDEERKAKLAELGYYDDTAEEQDFAIDWRLKPVSSAMKTNSVSGETTITDGKLAEFYANDTEHTEQEAEKARLDAEYDVNPWVIEQKEYEQERRNYINSLKHEIDELSKGVDKIAAGKYRAGALNDMPMSPKNYEKGLEAYRKESALVFAKTMLQDAETLRSGLEYRGGKWASEKDAFNRVISSNSTWNSEEYQEGQQMLLQTFQKLQEHFGSLNEWEPEEMEKVLTPEEMQMVNAFFELSAAEAETAGKTSQGFNVGRGWAANLPFMLEFLAYMGVSEAIAGPIAQGLTKAAAKTLARKAGASLVKRAANTAARQLSRAGIGAAKAAVIGATQTLAQGTTQTQVRDAMLSFDDDGYLTDDAKTAAVAYFDKAIENFSEATGDTLSGIIGTPLKGGLRALNKAFKTKAFTNIASAITESVPNKILKFAGWNGLFGELGEEVVGAAIRDLTISDGNLKHFFEKENLLETILTFLPMTVLGGTFSLGQLGYAKASMSSAESRMRSRLTDYISKDQLDYIISETQSTTPQHMAETMMPVILAMEQMRAGMKEIEAVRDYMVSAARYQSLMGVQEAKNTAEKEAFKASLEKEVGKFYHAPQVTNKAGETMELSPVVRTVTLKNGKTVYAVSQTNEAGEFLTIDVKTGEQGIAKESDVSESLNKEGKMQKSSITESLNEFLTRQVMLKHRETEADRMSQQYNEQVAGLQELLKEKQGHINLGTEGAPYEVLVDSTTEQGVKCIAPDGATVDLTWEQVGDALGQPIKLMTDQEIVDNEIADIARRAAERKAELARRKGTAESAEGAVTEAEKAQAKAEEDAKHIPMNPDGTVNETAFWEQDPEGYTQWNDEQNQDNGADSLRQIAASKQALLGLLSEAQKAAQTSVPADRKAAEREIARLQEKIARMEALEAKYAEEKVAPFRERAMKWKELTKAPVYIIETEEELKKLVKGIDEMTGESRVRGLAKDGKAYIYLPGIVDVAEIDAVFMHEAVAHVGLKGMLGEKMFNELLGEVWEMMSPAARRVFMYYPGVNADYLAAADEYVAHIAEKIGAGIADAEEQTIWQKIVGLVRKFLRAIGIELKMSEEELSSLLHQAYANLAENMAKAEQMGKSKAKLSVEESAPLAAQQEYAALAEDLTAEEIKAVAMNDYTAAQEAYDALAAEVPKVNAGESAKDFIARKKAYNEQVTAAKAELDARQALLDEIARMENEEMPVEEPEIVEDLEETVQYDGSLRLSMVTYHDWTDNLGHAHKGTRSQVLERMIAMNFSDAEINDMMRRMDAMYEYMDKLRALTNEDGSVRFDEFNAWAEKTPLYKQVGRDFVKAITSLVSNGDYPINMELTTDCIKREAFTMLLNTLVKRGADLSKMGPGEIVTIQKMMNQYGIEVACKLCFVEGKRLQIVNWASQIVEDWNNALIEAGVETDEYFEFGKDGDAFIPAEEWRTHENKAEVAKMWRQLDEIEMLFQGIEPKQFKRQQAKNKKAIAEYRKKEAEKWAKKNKRPASEWVPTEKQEAAMAKMEKEGLAPTYVNENMEEYRNAFNAMRNEWLEQNPGADPLSFTPTQKQWEALGKIRNRQIDTVRAKMVRLIMEYPEMRKKMTLNDLLGSKGLMEIRQQHGQAYADLYSIILQRFGTGTPKPVQDAVPYDGELMTLSEAAFKKANEIGGARLFSFSDFDITKVFDYMQMFFDLEANRQMLQSYTKEVAAVIIFGRSNAKFNISTLANAYVPQEVLDEYAKAKPARQKEMRHQWAENAGLLVDESGNITGINFSEEHSVSPAFAQQIFHDDARNKDCGAIMVGASVNHAIYSAAQAWIRMVIPFHLSGMPKAAQDKTDVKWYFDNTAFQSTRKKSEGKWTKISSSEDTFKFYDDMNQPGWNMRDKTKQYLAWCKEHGYRPKFDWGINSDYYRAYCEEQGYEPNQQIIDIMDADTTDGVWNQYYKFLTDFTAYKPVFNEQGDMIDEIPSPQLPVQSNFDFSEMEREVLFEGEKSMLGHREENIKKAERHMDALAAQVVPFLNGEITEEEMDLQDDVFYKSSTDAENYLETLAENNTRLSAVITPQMDAEYLAAVERGDMETAQRMVIEAAKLAMPNTKVVDENGNPKVVYHQTNAKVYVNKETGQNWDELNWREKMEWDERDDWEDYWEEQDFNTFSRVNARTTNEFDGFFFAPKYDEYHEYGERTIAAFVNIQNPASREDYNIDSRYSDAGRAERIRLQEAGFDGVIRMEGEEVDEYIAFEPSQIKSADAVTYDDNGNVIPLSERFNPENPDIRFSAMTPHKSSIDELTDLFHVMNQDQALVPLFEKVAARCREFNLDVEFLDKDEYSKRVSSAEEYGAVYGRKIRFNVDTMSLADSQENAATILHEMIHACTNHILSADEWMLTDENLQAREELDAIFKEVKKRYPSEYGASATHELIAELSNPSFRAKLKESNLWDRFVNALRRLFGMEAKTDLLARTEDVLDVFLDNPDFFLADIMEPISDEDYVRFSLREEGQSAMDFYKQALRDYRSRYNMITDVELAEPTRQVFESLWERKLTDEEYAKMLKSLGVYKINTGKIYIFVKDDVITSKLIEDALFHESIHALCAADDNLLDLGAWLWENTGAEDSKRSRVKRNIIKNYKPYQYHEEMLATVVGECMAIGKIPELASLLPEHERGTLETILNEIGYDIEYETEPRLRQSDGELEAQFVHDTNLDGRTEREAGGEAESAGGESGLRYSVRTKPAPEKTQPVYKLMRLGEDGKLYPLFIGNAEAIELGTWYDADSPNLGDLTKLPSGIHLVNNDTGEAITLEQFKSEHPEIEIKGKKPNVAAVNWATANGMRWIEIEDKATAQRRYEGESRSYYNLGINSSGQVGQFAMRPGWHAGSLPSMRQIGKGKDKNLRDDSFVWVRGRVPADVDYQAEADANPDKDIPTHIPTDGFYMKATNANKKASQADKIGWYVAGSFIADEIISDAEARRVIDEWNAGHAEAKVEYDYPRESGKDFDPAEGIRLSVVSTPVDQVMEISALKGLRILAGMNLGLEGEMTMVEDMIASERNIIKRLQKKVKTPIVEQQIKNAEERLKVNLRQLEILQDVKGELFDTSEVKPDYDSVLADTEPQTPFEYLSKLFTMTTTPVMRAKVIGEDGKEVTGRQGRKKNGIMLTPETLQHELGWSKSDWSGLKYIVSAKEGMTIDAIAEMVQEDSGENWMFSGMDTMQIKDEIIDFLMSMETYADIRDYIKNERMRLAEEHAEDANNRKGYRIEQLEAELGMTIEQYNEMLIQQARDAREKWLEEAENPEEFAKFEQLIIDEYGKEATDETGTRGTVQEGARGEEGSSDKVSTDDGRTSSESESANGNEDDGDLPEGDAPDNSGGDRGPGNGGGSRRNDSRTEAEDSESGVVSTETGTSEKTVDEIVESGKQKVLEENAAAADVFIRRLYEINGELAKLRRAAAAQREYDKNTVQIITRLANELLENGALSDVTRYEIKRILSVINGAVGRNDLTVSVDRLMDIMIGNQLRYGRNRFDGFMKIRGKKVDARGVEVRGRLDIEGQAIMDAMREGISLDIARLEERIAEAKDRLTDASETVRRNAENDLVGYQLAKRYLEEIKESEAEEKDLRKELKDAGEVHKAGQMTDEAYKEFKKSTYDAIRENRMHRVEAYEALLSDMADMIQKSIKNAGQLRDAEKARVENIHHMANSDLQGMPASAHEQKVNKFWNNPIVRLFTAPFATFEQWMKLFGQKSAEGKGYLYNHFIGAWNKANNEEYLGIRDAHAILDAKVKEVFGGELDRWSDLFAIDKKLPKMKISMWDDGAMREFEVTQGNLLYIYMVNKMTDGKMKLRKMGITEEDIDAFVKLMDPRFIQLADWMQDEFLPGLRDKYNAVHERMFGAPMAAIDSYFPIKVNSNARTRDVELGTDTESGRPSSITGSIIKRTKNSLALDVLGSNAFDVLLEHIEQMEHWAAFAEFNRDLNTLLSYRLFRNRVQNMSTAYGSGQEAWNSFKETAEIVAGVYRPKTSGIDKALTNAVRGFTAGKINFRLWTALKQTLSMPAFLAYANPATFAKNIATPWEAWNWAMENLPAFEKRWKSREAGNVRLKKTEADWAIWQSNAMEAMTRWGMTPNAFVDAVTCSIGAKSVYDTMYARYIKDGYSHEKADEKAKLDATTAFNATQQSSESAFLAAVQADRTFVAHMATVFRNNSFGMGRELVSALRQTKDRMKEGFKEESIEFMKKQMMRDGLTAEQATRAAERVYRNSAIKDAARIALFGFGMQFLWNLGGSAVYLLFGDDDEEKRKLVKDAALRGAFGSFESMSFGNLVPEMAASIASGNIKNFHPSLSPAGSDIASLWNEMLKDPVAGTSELVNILVQAGFGVNPQVLANSVVAIVDACDGDMELSKEVGIALLRVLQAPQSNIDKLIMDEIDFTNDKGLDITIDEFAKEYAQYKKLSNASYTWWAYSDENEKKIEDKYIKRFQKTAKELRRTRGTEEAQKYYQYVDEEYKEVGTTLRELKKKVEDAAKQGDNVTALEYAKQIQEFTQTPEFKKYSRMAGYEKAIQKLSKAMKDVSDKATRERLEDKMLELRKTMVEELEKIENTEQ